MIQESGHFGLTGSGFEANWWAAWTWTLSGDQFSLSWSKSIDSVRTLKFAQNVYTVGILYSET